MKDRFGVYDGPVIRENKNRWLIEAASGLAKEQVRKVKSKTSSLNEPTDNVANDRINVNAISLPSLPVLYCHRHLERSIITDVSV